MQARSNPRCSCRPGILSAGSTESSGGYRTHLGVPLLSSGRLIGVILVSRTTVRPFDDKQIELAATFADQAAIAMENARLFDELQEKSRQLEIANFAKSRFLAAGALGIGSLADSRTD